MKNLNVNFIYKITGLMIINLIINNPVFAQIKIEGGLLNKAGAPIAYANVLLLQPTDSSLIKGAISLENGSFQLNHIEAGKYLLSITMVGYDSYFNNIEVSNVPIIIHPITLNESSKQLDEILVAAQKPLFEKQVDKMVVNVQQSITAAGNSVLQVLQKSPGINVNRQNNTISMNGKSGVTVMINNKLTRLPIDAVLQMLDGMSAANVEKIELISNPSSKYDAEGTAGIIHIVMLENADFGTNGSYGITAGMNGGEILGGNFNVNHRRKNFSLFADYSILHDKNIQDWHNQLQIENQEFTSRFNSSSKRIGSTTVQNFRTGAEVNIGKKTSLGALITLYQRYFIQSALTDINNLITADSSRNAVVNISEINRWQSFTGNVNLNHYFNDKNSLRLDLDFLHYNNHNPSNYKNDFYYPEINYSRLQVINVKKETPINFKVASLEYAYRPSDIFSLEAGVKGSLSTFKNDVEVSYTEEGIKVIDSDLSVMANLDEKILAGFLSSEIKINKSNQFNAGIRYEQTSTYISTQYQKGVVDKNYGNFFPNINFKRSINDNIDLFLGYSRRITRPTFNNMAPFVYILDPNTFFSGNPALKPAIIDGINLSTRIRQSSIALNYSNSKNEIANFQPSFDPETKKQVFRAQNLEYQKLYNLTFSLPWIISAWWEIQANLNGFYRNIKTSHLENNIAYSLYNYSLNISNNMKLPKDFSLEITGNYESKMIWGMWQFEPLGSLNIGLQKKLNNSNGTLSLALDDLLYTNIWKIRTAIPESNSYSSSDIRFNSRSIRLSFTRNFGNNKLKSVTIKSGSEEERKRVN